MNLLLVNTPQGTQEIISVGLGGGYFDSARVLWDERTDGSLPKITLGGMVRVGNALQLDSELLSSNLGTRLIAAKSAFMIQIDTEADALIRAVIGERASQYEGAERESLAYQAAGYTGTVPPKVQAWATAKNQTATWAADSQIATAAVWRNAENALYAKRLLLKETVRVAVDVAELDTIKADWAGFMSYLRGQLGA